MILVQNRPDGGARREACEKSGLEIVIWHVRSVCAIFGMDTGNGDKSRAKSVRCRATTD